MEENRLEKLQQSTTNEALFVGSIGGLQKCHCCNGKSVIASKDYEPY